MNRIGWLIVPKTLAALLGAPALAQGGLPDGGRIVEGQGAITHAGNAMTVHQASDKLIANWQSFSIGKDATVTFSQPNAASVALNRVVGQSPSEILGALRANGRVFLVNPNGVLIGPEGSVQTGAFVASTLGLADRDFLAGKYRFSGEGGSIVNRGSIDGQVVALIAPAVTNEGSIRGSTALAAGTGALLDFDGDGLLSVQVEESTLAALVENKGLIQSDGGMAILTAKGASEALKGIVNNTGTVQARTITRKQGRILLLGDMQHGESNVAGTLDASAPSGGDGGFIETSAARVKVADGARITTRADSGKNGQWLIDPNDFTIAAAGGNITGSALSTQLDAGDVTISTATQGAAGGNGDIFVNDTVNWSSNTLTLQAERNININTAMNATVTAGLALEYGQGAVAAGNTATYTVNAPVNLASTGSFSTKLGSDGATVNYRIITGLGNQGSSNDGTLQGIAGDLSGNYVLGADIDASATNAWNVGAGFAPIGDNSTGNWASWFNARFDGLGHEISGLVINRAATDYVGLFGYVDGGVVQNVTLAGGSVTGRSSVGQLAGGGSGAISGAAASGTVSGTDNVGGLVGTNFGTITNSRATGAVSGNTVVGGLAGVNTTGTISGSHATGNVTATAASSQAGGLLGYLNGGTVSNSYATGQVSGVAELGGLIGFHNAGTVSGSYATGNVTATAANSQAGGLTGFLVSGTISNSYATGQVSGTDNVGGLLGFLNGGTVSLSYATGQVTGGGGGNVGGLVGFAHNGAAIGDSVWDTATTGMNTGCGINSTGTCTVTGLITSRMKDPFTFIDAGWNFSSVWGKSKTAGNSGYMVLRALDSTAYDDYIRLANTNLSRGYGGANPSLSGIALDGVGTNNATLAWGSAVTSAAGIGSYAYATPNVLSVSGNNGRSVYTEYGSGALAIHKATLTVTANDASKTYDGQAFSGGNGVSYSGFVNGENTAALSGTVSYGGTAQGARNAGSYTITASGLSAQNYDISYANGSLTVDKAAISAIAGITANNKTYDGTTAATLNTTNATFSGVVAGDTLGIAGASGAFIDKNAGSGKQVNITGITLGGADAGNYTFAGSATTTADITRASITRVTGIAASDKTYDGTTAATLNTAGAAFGGMVAGDKLSVATASGAFADKNAGTGKTVHITGITLGGSDAGNYTLADSSSTATAGIGRAAVSEITGITAENKFYDGTTAATLNTDNAAFKGMIAGDSLNVATAAGNFADANPGAKKTVFITGLSLGGTDAGNYSLTDGTASATADIYAIAPPLWRQQTAAGGEPNVGTSAAAPPIVELISDEEGKSKAANSASCGRGGEQGGASECGATNTSL